MTLPSPGVLIWSIARIAGDAANDLAPRGFAEYGWAMTKDETMQDGTGEAERAAGHERKQEWKERNGNRYTAEELGKMAGSLGTLTISETDLHVMELK